MSEKRPPIAESMVRDGLSVGAGVIASHNPLAGALAGLAIGPTANAAGRVQQWFGDRFSRRVVQTAVNLGERAEAEGIEPDQEPLEELLENGLPFIGRASVEEKRRLMEEILMNGVRSLEDQAKRIDAIDALQLIEAIPDGAVLIFVSFLRKLSGEDDVLKIKGSSRDSEVMPKCGLSDIVYQDNLFVIFNREGSKGADIQGKTLIASQYRSDVGETHYFLSERGKFLARWITNNPAPRPQYEEVPPTE